MLPISLKCQPSVAFSITPGGNVKDDSWLTFQANYALYTEIESESTAVFREWGDLNNRSISHSLFILLYVKVRSFYWKNKAKHAEKF